MFKIKKDSGKFEDFAGDDKYYGDGGFDEMDENDAEAGAFDDLGETAAPSFGAPAAPALKIVNPKDYKDATEIANLLMNGNTVLLNIESIAKEQAIRLLDYLSGAVHVAGGLMTKVSKTTIVIAPKNVDVSSIEAMVSGN